jgi:hypothetical protein
MKRWGFEYEAVSELNTASSAYTAIYWDKMSNWITVAFKGGSLVSLLLSRTGNPWLLTYFVGTTPPEFDGE